MARRKLVATQKDMQELEELAKRQGWEVHIRDGGHLDWVAPDGSSVTSAMTGTSRSVTNTKALLKGQGMLLDKSEIRLYEKARKQVEQAFVQSGIKSDVSRYLPMMVVAMAVIINDMGQFDMTCVCGVQKVHPAVFVQHVRDCPRAKEIGQQLVTEDAQGATSGEATMTPKQKKEAALEIPDRCEHGHELRDADGKLVRENVYIWPTEDRWVCKACRRGDGKPRRATWAPAEEPAPAAEVSTVDPEPPAPEPEVAAPALRFPANLNLRDLAYEIIEAAGEALSRPTEEEVQRLVEKAVAEARAQERASAEELMNELIGVTEERDQARREAAAERARADGLATKVKSLEKQSPRPSASEVRNIGRIARS